MVAKRNTVQRQLIFNAVKELNIHATAEQVYDYVIKKYPSISKATVYRNLSQMAESGELLNIGSFHGLTHYDHNCHEHYHFICGECRRVFDAEIDYLSDINETVQDKYGFKVQEHDLVFKGVCLECA